MLTILQAIGLNKWLVYGAIALSVLATLGVIVLRIRAGGAQTEKSKQVLDTLRNFQKETKERARIEAMRSATARQRLRDKWSARD